MSATDNQKNIPSALPAGYRFNEFEIQDVIGGGGFGIVYRAWDHLLERTIAIKEYMPVALAMRDDNLTMALRSERYQKMFDAGLSSFIQEARLLARFNHPGLLHVLRFWEQNGTAYMGTLFYEGMTLKAWQQTSPQRIDDAWIRRMLPPLFGAISTIHRAGYLHRDISLDNILIQENQLPLLLDFGSARREIGNLTDNTEIMLKPGYAPIEQYSEDSDGDQGPWSDIYALGAVLHALVTGSAPPVSVVRCIEDNYQPLVNLRPAGFSLPLLHAIDSALALKPESRPQSIEEFAALVELPVTAVEELVTRTDSPPQPAPADEPLRGHDGATRGHEPARSHDAQRNHEPTRSPEPELPSVNPGTGAAEIITARNPPKLTRPLLALACIALVVVVALVVWLNRGKPQPQTAGAPAANPAADSAGAAAAARTAATGPALATVYLKLDNSQQLLLNGQAVDVKPNTSGYTSLNLAAGSYTLEVKSASGTRRQQLQIDKAGTWLINLP